MRRTARQGAPGDDEQPGAALDRERAQVAVVGRGAGHHVAAGEVQALGQRGAGIGVDEQDGDAVGGRSSARASASRSAPPLPVSATSTPARGRASAAVLASIRPPCRIPIGATGDAASSSASVSTRRRRMSTTTPSASAASRPASAAIAASDLELLPDALAGPGSAKSTICSLRPAASSAGPGVLPGLAGTTGVRRTRVWRTTCAATALARCAASPGPWALTVIFSRRVTSSAFAVTLLWSWVMVWWEPEPRSAAERIGRLVARSA